MDTRRMLRKVLFMAVMLMAAFTLQAQEKGDMAAGANLSYGTKDGYNNFGVGAKFQYNLTDALRLEPSATYFFKKDYLSMWDINVNLHYLFPLGEKFSIYPLAGVSLLGAKADYDDWVDDVLEEWGVEGGGGSSSETKFGANLGAGAQYWLTSGFALTFEVKYQLVSDFDRPVFTLGGAFRF